MHPGFKWQSFSIAVLFLLINSFAQKAIAQQLPLPAHQLNFDYVVRGYYFTAPANFTITSLKVPSEAGSGLQYIQVFKINDATPSANPINSSNITTLAYIAGAANNVQQPVSIAVATGDKIGIFGTAGVSTSFSASTSFVSDIGGTPVTLNSLSCLSAGTLQTPMPSYTTTAGVDHIGRIEMSYVLSSNNCASPIAPLFSNITPTSASINWTQNGSTTGWVIKYGPSGFNPSLAGTSIFTTNKPYTLNGLLPATAYDIYIKAVCAVGDTTAWSAKSSIMTACDPAFIVFTKDSSRCGPGEVTLEAQASPGAVVKWYADSIGGTPLDTGMFFTTPSINSTTTYYASVGGERYVVGLSNTQNYTFLTQNPTWGSLFTAHQNCVLDSVTVYPTGTGTISIKVLDPITNMVLYAGPIVNITGTGGNTPVVVPVLATLPPGNYKLGLSTTGITGLGSQVSGNTMGYTFASPLLTITSGSQLGLPEPTVYYWFYNWKVSSPGAACQTTRHPVTAFIKDIPQVDLGNDTTICPGVAYNLDAGNPGHSYEWTNGATTQIITVNAAGIFGVEVTGNNGCLNSDSILIIPGLVPSNMLPSSVDLCDMDTISLNAGNAGSTFLWTPNGETTQSIELATPGVYSVLMESTDGCTSVSNTSVVLRPLPVEPFGNDTIICSNELLILDAGNPGYSYQWAGGESTQTIIAADSGKYSVLITGPFNCTRSDSIHVGHFPMPLVEGFNFIPLFHEQLGKVRFQPLNPTNVVSYLWDFGDGTANATEMNPEHTFVSNGDYLVTLRVFNDCGDLERSLPIHVGLSTGVTILENEDPLIVLYPNPSSQDINVVTRSSGIDIKSLTVTDILGRVVFSKSSLSKPIITFSVSAFSNGHYLVRIMTNRGLLTKRFEVVK